ncbi:MAG TPA: N-acetylneuraminate synthase [Stellaceae bacterium]|nr:N-acetylneuraminate synthase [Stellaceae bacterium]
MSDRVLIIAEAGVNHNGSLERARALVDAALAAGADIVKFQTFRADRIATRSVGKAEYQKQDASAESQHAMLKRLELDEAAHADLIAYCRARGIEFLSTPFDLPSVALLTGRHGLRRLKISSGDLTNGPLLLAAARSGASIILSTGMSTLGEVEAALGVLAFGMTAPSQHPPSAAAFAEAYRSAAGQQALGERVTLLHCTSRYPAPPASVNLRAMATLGEAFGLKAGYSDHTVGTAVPIAAAALGATVIEKHFTLDRTLPGPDHKASLEPKELEQMVTAIRTVEVALGSALKAPAEGEAAMREVARKALVAARAIRHGERFTADALDCKRAEGGASAMRYWEALGRIAGRDYAADEPIEL